MTNEHCVNTKEVASGTQIDLDADGPDDKVCYSEMRAGTACRAILNPTFLWANPDLDYSLLTISGVTRDPVIFARDTKLQYRQKLLLIQHPRGGPKKVAADSCIATRGRQLDYGEFSHVCSSDTGSSGSPIFDLTSKRVVGLHHKGSTACRIDNYGIMSSLIIADIQKRSPSLYEQMMVQ
jgi:hypothetical protein